MRKRRRLVQSVMQLALCMALGGSLTLGALSISTSADESAQAGGWLAGDVGFHSTARVPADSTIKIRVVTMGNSRGLVVTYSGNPQIYQPGKLWSQQELREGGVYEFQIVPPLADRPLAIRSGAIAGRFDRPLKVESIEGGSRLHFAGGRVVEVAVVRPKSRR